MAISFSKSVPAPEAVGKRVEQEELGSVIGRRSAGLTTIGGGDQMLHAFNWYGKDAPPGIGVQRISVSRALRGPIF